MREFFPGKNDGIQNPVHVAIIRRSWLTPEEINCKELRYSKNCYIQLLWLKTTLSLWPKFHAQMILHRKVSVVSDYLPNVTSDRQILHAQSHSPGLWDHSRVHMYPVVGLCKLGIIFCETLNHKDVRYQCTVYVLYQLGTLSGSGTRQPCQFMNRLSGSGTG